MKALRLTGPDTLNLVEIAVPPVGATEVLIRTGASTICTSDLIDIHANPFGIALPVILGHEGAGTIAAIGEMVNGIRIGDLVAAHPVHPCSQCRVCIGGLPHLCPRMRHLGHTMQGTFAEFFVADADRVRVFPAGTDAALAALTEPVCVCLEALQQASLSSNSTLLIIGDGPFGLIMARLAARRDIATVMLAGGHDFRLAFARHVHTINTAHIAHPVNVLIEATDGAGFDAVILAVNSTQAVDTALDVLKPRGRLVLFAAVHGKTPVDLAAVHRKELEIRGSCNDSNMLDQAVGLLENDSLALIQLITHRFPVDQYAQAFALAATGQHQAVKVALTF
jgi:2-desacetyl-2-hydroxyethyl bacteriochlorophyllide A dehydrogenase